MIRAKKKNLSRQSDCLKRHTPTNGPGSGQDHDQKKGGFCTSGLEGMRDVAIILEISGSQVFAQFYNFCIYVNCFKREMHFVYTT